MSIFINEVGTDLLPITERMGRPEHSGLAYAFDAITEVKVKKRSYNISRNRMAFDLFNDSDFITAHGSLAPASSLQNTTDERWRSQTYPQADYPTTLERTKTGFIQEADFFKFRGRGFIQVTWRPIYRRLIEYVQSYTGSNAKILDYKSRWASQASDVLATKSTNADWDDLFQNTELIIPCVTVRLHNQGAGGYLSLATDAPTLNGKGPGSIYNVGKGVSSGSSYATLFKNRVIQICNALGNGQQGTTI